MTVTYATKNISGSTHHVEKQDMKDVFEALIHTYNDRQNALFNIACTFFETVEMAKFKTPDFKAAKRLAQKKMFRSTTGGVVVDCYKGTQTIRLSLKERNTLMDHVYNVKTGKATAPKREFFKKHNPSNPFAKIECGEGFIVGYRGKKEIHFYDGSKRFGWTRFVNCGMGKSFMKVLKSFDKKAGNVAMFSVKTETKGNETIEKFQFGNFTIVEHRKAA